MKLAVLILFSLSALAQVQMFKVENPKNDKSYNQVEAVRAYWYAVETVRTEYHILDKVSPELTLRLGAKANGIDWNLPAVDLTTWDRRYFRMGVMALTLNELMKSENLKRLELRIEAFEGAKVNVEDLKK
jgi:hypothetical protein